MTAIAPIALPSSSSWSAAADSASCPSAQLNGACALLALLIQTQSTTENGGRIDIEWNKQQLDDLKQQLADAVQKAKDAASDSGFFGFLGDVFGTDIAQIAGAVAAVAAVVATGGAAVGPLIAIALSEALQVTAKFGPELGLPPEACLAIAVASVAVGFCGGAGGGQAIGDIASTARDVQLGAKLIGGTATIEGAVLHYTAAQFKADSLRYQADLVGYNAQSDASHLDIDDALDLLSRSLRTAQHETATVSEIVRADSDANLTINVRI
jgi:hypothetical protein